MMSYVVIAAQPPWEMNAKLQLTTVSKSSAVIGLQYNRQ